MGSKHFSVLFFFCETYLFLAFLGLCCCLWTFSNCSAQASHCCGFSYRRTWAPGAQTWMQCLGSVVVACGLWTAGSAVVVHGPNCSVVCWIFPGQGLNLCPMLWQADSSPLDHKESPKYFHVYKTHALTEGLGPIFEALEFSKF